MTFEHIVYIPGILLLGIVTGYVLGARAVRAEIASAQKKARR